MSWQWSRGIFQVLSSIVIFTYTILIKKPRITCVKDSTVKLFEINCCNIIDSYRRTMPTSISSDLHRILFLLRTWTGDMPYKDWVRVIVTLRLAACRQLVRLGAKPREAHDQTCYFFFSIDPFRHVIENSSFCAIYKSSVSPGFAKPNIPTSILSILC
jgi:hypothetical protein